MYKGSLYDKLVIISDVGCKLITLNVHLSYFLGPVKKSNLTGRNLSVHWVYVTLILYMKMTI